MQLYVVCAKWKNDPSKPVSKGNTISKESAEAYARRLNRLYPYLDHFIEPVSSDR